MKEGDFEMIYNIVHVNVDEQGESKIPAREDSSAYTINESNSESIYINTASAWSSIINLASTVMGVGILSLPYAFSRTGWLLGSIFLVMCACFSIMGCHLLALCALKSEIPSSFHSVASAASLGRISIFIDVAVLMKCVGVAISYPIIISDLMPPTMKILTSYPSDAMIYQRNTWVAITLFITAPLSFLRKFESLKWTSFLTVIFLALMIVMMLSFLTRTDGLDPCEASASSCSHDVEAFNGSVDSLRVFTMFIFVYTCQHNTFAVVNEIRRPTGQRLNLVFASAMGTSMIFYFLVGLSGYTTFGSAVAPNTLKSYPENVITSVARILVCFVTGFHFPLQCNPGRRCALCIWKTLTTGEEPPPSEYLKRFVIITVCFISITFLVAFNTSDLGKIVSVVGATGSVAVTYIVPGVCYYSLHRHQGPVWKRYYALMHGSFGAVVMPVALFFIFYGE